MNYDRIAKRLTQVYTENGKLPLLAPDEISAPYAYTQVEYSEIEKGFIYTGPYILPNGEAAPDTRVIYIDNPISIRQAVQEIWPVLSEDEKTELMTEVLGKK